VDLACSGQDGTTVLSLKSMGMVRVWVSLQSRRAAEAHGFICFSSLIDSPWLGMEEAGMGLVLESAVLFPLSFLGRCLWTHFPPVLKLGGAVFSPGVLRPTLLDRFDSNASASSSSNEGDSDRDEKKRKQLKKAKMAKDRKSRKKPTEVRPPLRGRGAAVGEGKPPSSVPHHRAC